MNYLLYYTQYMQICHHVFLIVYIRQKTSSDKIQKKTLYWSDYIDRARWRKRRIRCTWHCWWQWKWLYIRIWLRLSTGTPWSSQWIVISPQQKESHRRHAVTLYKPIVRRAGTERYLNRKTVRPKMIRPWVLNG